MSCESAALEIQDHQDDNEQMDTTNPKVGVRSAWSTDLLETMVHNVSCESLDMYLSNRNAKHDRISKDTEATLQFLRMVVQSQIVLQCEAMGFFEEMSNVTMEIQQMTMVAQVFVQWKTDITELKICELTFNHPVEV